MMNTQKILLICSVALLLLLTGAPWAPASVQVQCPADTDGIDTDGDGIVDNDIVCMHLAAGDGFVKMADGSDSYCFGFSDVTGYNDDTAMTVGMLAAGTPAPTIRLREGQRFYLNLTNVGMLMRGDLFDPHTVHFHGFPNASTVLDGEPMASVAINQTATLTYFYELVFPGTYMYHCHVEASEHMQMGMLGQIYVEAKQNMLPDGTDLHGFTHHTGYKYVFDDEDGSTYYDVDFPIQITAFDPVFHEEDLTIQPLGFASMDDKYVLLNGRGYPDTINPDPIINMNGHASQNESAIITAQQGQKILIRFSSLSTVDFYTLTVLGIPMKVVGLDARLLRGPDPDGNGPLLGKNMYYDTSWVTLGGGESADVILDTSGVAPGTYFLYVSNLDYLSNNTEDFGGGMTEITVTP